MKIPIYFPILVLVLFIASGNQVQMAVIPKCVVESLPVHCEIFRNPCEILCKQHFGSPAAHGACGIKIHAVMIGDIYLSGLVFMCGYGSPEKEFELPLIVHGEVVNSSTSHVTALAQFVLERTWVTADDCI